MAALVAAVMLPAAGAEAAAGTCSPACIKRVKAKVLREHRLAVVRPYHDWLRRVAWCESHGDYRINTGNGFFGAFQFALSSWRAVGGRGYPHHASRLEQNYRAVRLRQRQGRGAWPVCG